MKENWSHTTFGEFIDCNPKISIKKGEVVENCEMEDINIGYKFLYPREGKLYNGSNSKFQNGDTVFARITPCLENGKIAQIKGLKTKAAIGSTEFFVFRGKSKVSDNEFVYYLSQSNLVRDTAVNSMTGASGRQRADLKALKRLEIIVPKDINHQKRIASILSAYDDLIEINNKRIELLEQSARELYKEWFVRMRFPNYQNTKFNKGIPEGWKEEYLGNILELAYGKALKEEDRISGLYPVYGSSGIVGYHIEPFVKNSSIIVGRKGNVGSVFYSFKECFPIDTVFYVISDYSKFYLYQLLKEQTFIEGDAAVPGLNRNQAYKSKILQPTKELINQYDINIHPIFNQIENLQTQNLELTEIRNRLLPRLISGKLEVKA